MNRRASKNYRIVVQSATGWKRPLDEPIPLPRGRWIVTLEDAGQTASRDFGRPSTKPRSGRRQWKPLILVATLGGPTMLARIGVMRALNHGKPDPAPMPRRKRAKAYRVIR